MIPQSSHGKADFSFFLRQKIPDEVQNVFFVKSHSGIFQKSKIIIFRQFCQLQKFNSVDYLPVSLSVNQLVYQSLCLFVFVQFLILLTVLFLWSWRRSVLHVFYSVFFSSKQIFQYELWIPLEWCITVFDCLLIFVLMLWQFILSPALEHICTRALVAMTWESRMKFHYTYYLYLFINLISLFIIIIITQVSSTLNT